MKVEYSLVVIYCSLFLLLYIDIANAKGKSGPYLSRTLRTNKCEHPSLPYHENPRGIPYAELYNTSKKQNLIRGNITIFRENKNAQSTTKNFYWYSGKWKLVYLFPNVNCRSDFIRTLASAFGIQYINCSIPKGIYRFENIDLNALEHIWSKTKEYGRTLWKTESFYQGKIESCWETESIVMPLTRVPARDN